MRTRATVMTATAAAVLLLSGCQTEEEPDGTGSPTPTPTSSTATPTDAAPTTEDPTTGTASEDESETSTEAETATGTGMAEPTGDATETAVPSALPPWTSDPVEQAPQQAEPGQEITGVRTGLHDGFDRVVLDLSGDEVALGWFARLVDGTFEDGSGRPVEVEGERFVELGINSIDWTTEPPERYDGETVQGQGTEVVTEVVFGVLFEGQQQIFIGLDEDSEYRVFPLNDPARIVIDVRHP